MDEGISEKYAVYIDKDGEDVLEIVRDTEPEARVDMDGLKSKTTYIRIEKAEIKNFGKDDEKVIKSNTIASWDSSKGSSVENNDELSDRYKASDNNNATGENGNASAPPVTPPLTPIQPIVATSAVPATPIVAEIKPLTWQEHYAKHGALIFGDGWEQLTSAKSDVSKVPDVTSASTTAPIATDPAGITTTPTPAPSTDGIASATPIPEPKKEVVLNDADIDKIAERLKEKLGQNGMANNGIQSQPLPSLNGNVNEGNNAGVGAKIAEPEKVV